MSANNHTDQCARAIRAFNSTNVSLEWLLERVCDRCKQEGKIIPKLAAEAHMRRYGSPVAFCGAEGSVTFSMVDGVDCIDCLRSALKHYVRRGDIYHKALGQTDVVLMREVSVEVDRLEAVNWKQVPTP